MMWATAATCADSIQFNSVYSGFVNSDQVRGGARGAAGCAAGCRCCCCQAISSTLLPVLQAHAPAPAQPALQELCTAMGWMLNHHVTVAQVAHRVTPLHGCLAVCLTVCLAGCCVCCTVCCAGCRAGYRARCRAGCCVWCIGECVLGSVCWGVCVGECIGECGLGSVCWAVCS